MSTTETEFTALAGEEFADVMVMLAGAPLTGRERAEVIRRLLGESSAWSNPTGDWLIPIEAARLHVNDVDGLSLDAAKMRVRRACDTGQIICDATGTKRRIDPVSLDAWRLAQRERDLDRQDKPRPTLRA